MARTRHLLLVALLIVLSAPATAGATIPAPPSKWYGLPGLDAASGASWVRSIAYSTPPTVVYAGLEGGGVYKSTTGGATWSAFNAGFPNPAATNVRALLTSATDATVYAGTDDGIYTSTGGAWAPLAQGAGEGKLNGSVQSLLGLTGTTTMLAGVASGGVWRSPDDGATWSRPKPDNGMPSSETVYGLTSNVPGVVYATGSGGVYVSTDAGATWTRRSDGIPGSASPITTWAYPQKPQILFTSTGSNGIYRSLNGGLTWAPINDGLNAVRARGFQVFTATEGAHLYAATENGLWEALHGNSLAAPAPKWREVTKEGLVSGGSNNVIMWALTSPVIPGAGGLGLIAGTQSNGGYFISFEPPGSACPDPNTSNATAQCPRIAGTVTAGQTLTALNGTWTGTKLIDFAYQWQRCETAAADSCADVNGAEEPTFVIPLDQAGKRYRVVVTATNPAPTFGTVDRTSVITAAADPAPSTVPGYNQTSAPKVRVLAPGETTDPEVGDTVHADAGFANPQPGVRDEWFNPPATGYEFQWLRCSTVISCDEIPGATARDHTLTAADGTFTLRVRVTGTSPSGKASVTSPPSYDVESLPAAVADPLPPDAPGGPPKSQAPSLSGEAYVGETLAGDVGGWKDPTTEFLRRWLRCDANGGACTAIQKVASTDLEDGPTYVVRAGDAGSTIRMRVTADVNGDLGPDGIDNHTPKAVEVDTPPSAVVTVRPSGGGPGGGGGGGGGADTLAPALSGLSLTKAKVAPGAKTTLRFTSSEAGTARIVVSRTVKGRRVKGRCRPRTRANRKAKACKLRQVVRTVTRAVGAGPVSVPLRAKAGKRKFKPGRYSATVVVRDAAGNASKPLVVAFRVVEG